MKRAVASLLVVASMLLSAVASADVPPPDVCGKPGDVCKNAPPTYDQPGFCAPSKCRRLVPGDGGLKPSEWDCNKCIYSADAGPLVQAAAAASASPPTTAGTKSGCGCKLAGRSSGGAGQAIGAGLALAALVVRRRKKSG